MNRPPSENHEKTIECDGECGMRARERVPRFGVRLIHFFRAHSCNKSFCKENRNAAYCNTYRDTRCICIVAFQNEDECGGRGEAHNSRYTTKLAYPYQNLHEGRVSYSVESFQGALVKLGNNVHVG